MYSFLFSQPKQSQGAKFTTARDYAYELNHSRTAIILIKFGDKSPSNLFAQ
ncbi:hypothetical protein ATG66_1492 [Vibrio sp. ES.051]|nr:hypothetical protein ATG66_1492 [Vibrio sp. ES.051]